MLKILNEVFIEHGLKINAPKSETLILNWKLGQCPQKIPFVRYPDTIASVGNVPLKKEGQLLSTSANANAKSDFGH